MATAIIILNYNTASDTINCIQSIEAHNSAPIKYIVVDNGSSDQEGVERLNTFFQQSQKPYLRIQDTNEPALPLPYFTFLVSSVNDGYARGNNKGLCLAHKDPSIQNILILNSDILFSEDIIPSLVRVKETQANAGLITPLILSRKGTIDHCCARKSPTNWDIILLFLLFRKNWFRILPRIDTHLKILCDHPEKAKLPLFPIDVPSGACMLIDSALLEQIGDFDPNTFLYYEENILHKKLQRVSRISYCTPLVHCTHLGASSTLQLSSTFLQKCNLDSANYYLKAYCRLSWIQSLMWSLAVKLWNLKFRLQHK